MKSQTITSRHNPLLQDVRKAAAAGRLTANGCVVAEGPHLVEEASRGGWTIDCVLATENAQHKYRSILSRTGVIVVEISESAFRTVADTENSQGVLALLRPRSFSWSDIFSGPDPLVLVLDGLQDPGNAGTLVRSAEAFGATGVILTYSSVRVFNGKFLRATAGSIFRLPYLQEVETDELLSRINEHSLELLVLAAESPNTLWDFDLRKGCVFVVGSEGRGVSAELLRRGKVVSVPSLAVESLNAAVAGSIALFEARRQRAR